MVTGYDGDKMVTTDCNLSALYLSPDEFVLSVDSLSTLLKELLLISSWQRKHLTVM